MVKKSHLFSFSLKKVFAHTIREQILYPTACKFTDKGDTECSMDT